MIDERLLFSNCVLLENKLWYISVEGYLMYMDVESRKVSYAKIKNMDTWEKHSMSDQMFAYEGSIYWVDQFGKNIHEYNICLEEFYLYKLPETERIDYSCYAGIFMYEDKLFLFPKKMTQLIVFHMKKKKVIVTREMYEKLAVSKDNKENLLLYYAVQNNNCIYSFLMDMGRVLEFDICTAKYRYLSLPQKSVDISCAVCINNLMYILTWGGNVCVWNMVDCTFREIYTCNETELTFGRFVVTEHRIFLLPALSEKIIMMDLTGENISEIDNYPKDLQYRDINWGKYLGFDEDDRYILFANRTANYMLWINKVREEVEWKRMIPPTCREEYEFCKTIKHSYQDFYQQMSNHVLRENEYRMLYLFAIGENEREENSEEEKHLIGEGIWQASKG